MTKKDFYIALAIIIDVLVILTYSISNYISFMDFLNFKVEAGFVFWVALFYLIWAAGSFFIRTVLGVAAQKD